MPKKPKPTYVVELPLECSEEDTRRLNASFQAGQRLSNVMIGHGRVVVDAIWADPDWAKARKLPKKTPEDLAHRTEVFSSLRVKHGFSDSQFQGLAIVHKNNAGFDDRLGSHICQKIATKVYLAFEQYLCGKRGRPRFKSAVRQLHSLEGKNNVAGLVWTGTSVRIWKDWAIPVRKMDLSKDEWLASALQGTVRYCRIVRRNLHGKLTYVLQIVMGGATPVKASLLERLAPAEVKGGFDMGPSTLAYFTEDHVGIIYMCADVDRAEKALRRAQRKERRQARAMQKRHTEPGKAPPPERKCKVGSNHRTMKRAIASHLGRVARCRRQSVGRTCNALSEKAQVWQEDGVSVRSLQRNYGRSVARCNPGMHRTELTRKAERAGGEVRVVDVWALKTSQYDHSTDKFTKKTRSERWHVFGDGRGTVQRDVYSAFLHYHAKGAEHDPVALEKAWQGAVDSGVLGRWYRPAVSGISVNAPAPQPDQPSSESGLAHPGGVAGPGRASLTSCGAIEQRSHGRRKSARKRVTASSDILSAGETPA